MGDAPHQATPILPGQLASMLSHLSDSPGHTAFKAAILTLFSGLLRKAHITNSDAPLLREDFSFYL